MAIADTIKWRVERAKAGALEQFSSASGDRSPEMRVVVEDNPLAEEFVCFCLQRRGHKWPELYDEMCRVARSRAFRGMGYSELSEAGVSLSITGLDRICQLVDREWAEGSVKEH